MELKHTDNNQLDSGRVYDIRNQINLFRCKWRELQHVLCVTFRSVACLACCNISII